VVPDTEGQSRECHRRAVLGRDITEQRRAEEQIRNLSRFPEENPNPVMRLTPDGVLLYANPSSRPFLTHWNIGIGQLVAEDCRTPVREAFVSRRQKPSKHIWERDYSGAP